jgi:dCMP deaminase
VDWDEYFIEGSKWVSTKSKDRSTKVGAIIVGPGNEIRSTGYNGFPRGVNDNLEERHQRPLKYSVTTHAETNAIVNAVRSGISTLDCKMYMNFSPPPCNYCSQLIIQSGIIEVIGPPIPFKGVGKGKYYDVDQIALSLLNEAKIKLFVYDGEKRITLVDWLRKK